jgi:hypothetical protein
VEQTNDLTAQVIDALDRTLEIERAHRNQVVEEFSNEWLAQQGQPLSNTRVAHWLSRLNEMWRYVEED